MLSGDFNEMTGFENDRRAGLLLVVPARPARPPRKGGRDSVEPILTERGIG